MRFFSFFTACLIALLLTACGGGGGSPGISSGSVQTFAVAAPSLLTLQVGLTQQYTIQGGVKPYSVVSSDPAVAVGWLVGENVVAVGSTAAGKAVISVQDAKGTKFDIGVTAGSSTAFFTTAPPSPPEIITLNPASLAGQTYKLGGGTPPYKAVSTNPTLVSVVVNGTDVIFTALQIPGTADIIMTDSASPPTVLTAKVTTGTIALAVNPSTTTMPVGATLRAVITGGTPPYRTVVLDNCSTNAKIVQGNILEATGSLACTGSAITVVDANNQSASLTLTITAGTVGLQVAPSAFTIPESTTTPNLSLLVYGANGPLQVFTTNTAVLAPQTPVKNSDGTYTVALTGGNTCSAPIQVAIAGVDNTVPPNGTFTDTVIVPVTQPTADIAPVPAAGGDRSVTITVLDSTGRQGTSVLTVKDTNGKPGC